MNTNEVWFDVEGEHRRLYATRKLESGKWVAYLDRNTVLEFNGWPIAIPETLKAEDVQSISVMPGAKGVYLIITKGGGSWGGHLLRRGYLAEEQKLIPKTSEEATMTNQERWDKAEENARQLEEIDAWFYSLSAERLREIRQLPFSGYKALSEYEKHYWVTTQERRGENADNLKKAIAIYDKDDAEARLSEYKIMIGAALQAAAPGKATKPKSRQAVTVKRAAIICNKTIRQISNWEVGTNTPKDWPGRNNLKRLMEWQADRVKAEKIGVAIDNAARHGNMDSVSARKPGGLPQYEKNRQAEFDNSIDRYSRDDDRE